MNADVLMGSGQAVRAEVVWESPKGNSARLIAYNAREAREVEVRWEE